MRTRVQTLFNHNIDVRGAMDRYSELIAFFNQTLQGVAQSSVDESDMKNMKVKTAQLCVQAYIMIIFDYFRKNNALGLRGERKAATEHRMISRLTFGEREGLRGLNFQIIPKLQGVKLLVIPLRKSTKHFILSQIQCLTRSAQGALR